MKMEIPIEAERAGTVVRIDSPPETVVDEGTTIITLR
jgi:biotin carboxyl carrier protein